MTEDNIVGKLIRFQGAVIIGPNQDSGDSFTGWYEIKYPTVDGVSVLSRCWVTGNSAYVEVPNGFHTPDELNPLRNGSGNPENLLPNHVYWIKISEANPPKFYIAPPPRRPDGSLIGQ